MLHVNVYVDNSSMACDPRSLRGSLRNNVSTQGRAALEASLSSGQIPKCMVVDSDGAIHKQDQRPGTIALWAGPVLGVAFVSLLVWFLDWLGVATWSGLIVVPYLAVGTFDAAGVLAVGLISTRALSRLPHPAAPMFADMTAAKRHKKLGRIQGFVDTLLKWPAVVIAWPLVHRELRGRQNVKAIADLRIRRPLVVTESVWTLCFVVLLTLLVRVSGHHWYLRFACYVVIAAILAGQARFVINGDNLRQELRRTVGSPVAQFALIALANFAALTVAAFVLLRWPAGSPFHWRSLWLESRQILSFSHVGAVFGARHTGATTVFVATAGVAVYASLLGQFLHPLQFLRSDNDRLEVVRRLLLAGDSENADRWLKDVGRGDRQLAVLHAEGMLGIKSQDFNLALQRARGAAVVRRLTTSPEDEDDARWILGEWAQQLRDGEACSDVVGYLVASGTGDPCLAAVIDEMLERGVPQLADALEAHLTDRTYPLSLSAIAKSREDWTGAKERLRSAVPRQEAGRLVKRMLLSYATVLALQADDRRKMRDAAAEDSRELVREAQSWHIEQFPLWLREWLAREIDARARHRVVSGDEQTAKALRELHTALEADVPSYTAGQFQCASAEVGAQSGRRLPENPFA